ncbi:OLC1v1025382C1 [Oldenlandia corymbosa var. corymbosa]|uniref:OLC1v1025382C1 n=1 Tax=Oldenlandia corymbosa var. corymbosa TaxID=529605 RepID=A0AAV1C4R9_OLDCO|nr:OLC1v1025382C1 [Oldenlandia corymbosa var. corymbosa]
MSLTVEMWVALIVGVAPIFVGLICWFWYDIWYGIPVSIRCIADGTKLPPGYMGFPFFGETFNFLRYFKTLAQPDDFINSRKHKYGDAEMFRTHLFGSPAIIAYSPGLNRFVFHSDTLFGQNWPSIELIGKNSVLAVEGPLHSRLKSFIARTISTPDALQKVTLMVQPRVIAALQTWAEKGRVFGYDEAKKLTLANIGKYFANFEPGPKLDILSELYAWFVKGARAYPIKIPGTTYYKALQCRKKALSIFKEELDKRKKITSWDVGANAKHDLMEGLMQYRDEEGTKLSEAEVLDNILVLLLAGYESTTLSITWALYYLAKHPHVLHKLREENLLSVKNKQGDMITFDEISKLSYTNKVVEEVLRLGNVSPIMFRIAKKDVEYKGYKIPKGWKVLCWIRYLHVNPENFEDPLTFNPDRWDDQPKPGTYLVFGAGKRMCVGNKLSRLQISIFIHHLVLGYRWNLINEAAAVSYLPNPKPVDGVEIAISKI